MQHATTHPALTPDAPSNVDASEHVEARGWVRAGADGHEFYVTQFRHPAFFSVAATPSISPSTFAYKLRKRGNVDWRAHGLYSIGTISPVGLISVWTPGVGGRLFPRNVKETYLYEVAQVLGFPDPKFVGKPSIAAPYVSRREAKANRAGRGGRLRSIFADMRWMVEAHTPQGWKEIYSAKTKTEAKNDAKKWTAEVGQVTRIKKGLGHPDARTLQAADDAWSAEGQRVFGSRWGDVRYTKAGEGEPRSRLAALFHAYMSARDYHGNRADGTRLDYVSILQEAFETPVTRERGMGSGRIYVGVDKEHAKGIKAAAKALGKIFDTKSHYGTRNALYVGYDNSDGLALARGTRVVEVLKAHGIGAYRDEHGD